MTIHALLHNLISLLYPSRCAVCDTLSQTALCAKCAAEYTPSTAAKHDIAGLDSCFSLLPYTGKVRGAVLNLKFHARLDIAASLGRAAAVLAPFLADDIDVVTYIPLSKKRSRERGYNQAEIFAKAFARSKGIPCRALLIRTRNTAANSGLSAAARKENVSGAFALKSGVAIKGKRILLCDDVLTTGSTVQSAAAVLRNGGAATVSVLCAAKTKHISDDSPDDKN
ncbi:MAG: ComF family protein [Oscillospiraceae bacterium]|jgi:ComF family protein|nr:ComF family protein [Oscillospiraceae bacterium]